MLGTMPALPGPVVTLMAPDATTLPVASAVGSGGVAGLPTQTASSGAVLGALQSWMVGTSQLAWNLSGQAVQRMALQAARPGVRRGRWAWQVPVQQPARPQPQGQAGGAGLAQGAGKPLGGLPQQVAAIGAGLVPGVLRGPTPGLLPRGPVLPVGKALKYGRVAAGVMMATAVPTAITAPDFIGQFMEGVVEGHDWFNVFKTFYKPPQTQVGVVGRQLGRAVALVMGMVYTDVGAGLIGGGTVFGLVTAGPTGAVERPQAPGLL